MTQESQLQQFQQVFDMLGSPIHIFSKSERGVIGGKIQSPAALQRWVRAASRPEDFYVCLNPSVTNRIKPRIEDITSFQWWLLDLDPISSADPNTYAALVVTTNGLLSLFGFIPNYYWVDSGRGRQMWIPVTSCGTDIPTAQLLVKGCTEELTRSIGTDLGALGFRLDEACAEVSHLARLPGTVNTRTGRNTGIASSIGGEITLTSGDMEQFISRAPEPSLPFVRWGGDEPPGIWQIMAWWNGLTPFNRAFIQQGVDTTVESRHRRATAAARQLRDLGCAPDTALGWLLDGADRCTPRLDGMFINRLYKETFK